MLRSLFAWVLVGMILGVVMGVVAPDHALLMKPFGDAFIRLIKMLVAPIIFFSIVTGVSGMDSMHHVGRMGIKALIYFELVTTLALALGLGSVHFFTPGLGMHIDPSTLDSHSISAYTGGAAHGFTGVDFLMHLIPTSFLDPFVHNDMLQILVISLLCAVALVHSRMHTPTLYRLISEASTLFFTLMGFVVWLAPLAGFGAMAYTVGLYGVSSLYALLSLVGLFFATCAVFVFCVLGLIARLCGVSIFSLIFYLRAELLLVLATSSSEVAMPRLIEKLEHAGCPRAIAGFVVPAGYSFNLDGTSIYLSMAAIFLAQAMDISLSFHDELLLFAVLLLTSKGAAGVTGSGFIVLAATLASVGQIPVEGIALILGVDRFLSTGRALTNFLGNAVACFVVARWEGKLDRPIFSIAAA